MQRKMERLLTVEEVASVLGMSNNFVYSLVSSNKLNCLKVANKYRFQHQDVEKYISSIKYKASEKKEKVKSKEKANPIKAAFEECDVLSRQFLQQLNYN